MTFSLIYAGADTNLADNKSNTPLHVAVQQQSIDCIIALLESEPEQHASITTVLNQSNDDGLTPFHLAVATNNLAVCKLLEEKATAAQISIHDCTELKKGNSILHIAVEHCAVDVARYLLKTKQIEDVNVRNAAGQTALFLARALSVEQSSEIIDVLLAHGAIDEESTTNKREPSISVQPQPESIKMPPPAKNDLQRKEAPLDADKLTRLCQIFNTDDKWKLLAIELGYNVHISEWQKRTDPAKMLFKFAEVRNIWIQNEIYGSYANLFFHSQATRVPRAKLSIALVKLGETSALEFLQGISK